MRARPNSGADGGPYSIIPARGGAGGARTATK